MLDSPPPSTIASGSSRLITCASPRASRSACRASAAAAARLPGGGARRAGRRRPARPARPRPPPAPGRRPASPGSPTWPHQQCGSGRSAGVTQGSGLCPHSPAMRLRPGDHPPVHHDPGAAAGADDDAEHRPRARARAVRRLRQGEAVGVVLDPHRAAERLGQVPVQRVAVQADGVGVLHQPGRRADHAGDADADRDRAELPPPPRAPGRPARAPRRRSRRRRLAAAQQHGAVRPEHGVLDLGAAEIDPHAQRSASWPSPCTPALPRPPAAAGWRDGRRNPARREGHELPAAGAARQPRAARPASRRQAARAGDRPRRGGRLPRVLPGDRAHARQLQRGGGRVLLHHPPPRRSDGPA